jgi:hypothetical protein
VVSELNNSYGFVMTNGSEIALDSLPECDATKILSILFAGLSLAIPVSPQRPENALLDGKSCGNRRKVLADDKCATLEVRVCAAPKPTLRLRLSEQHRATTVE